MKVEIINCNNIDQGTITIKENKLNIKYAINGTGKTTISSAIKKQIEDKTNDTNTLNELRSFKNIGKEDDNPEIKGIESISKVKVFDETYINEYVFLPDELLKGSFDIFIRNEQYEQRLRDINGLIEIVQKQFIGNDEIEELIKDLTKISESFGNPTQSGGLSNAGIVLKTLNKGNPRDNIPRGLEDYRDFIQNEKNVQWLKWQNDGRSFREITKGCPYCTSNIDSRKEQIDQISDTYNPKTIENLNMILEVFHRLGKYFSEDTRNIIDILIKCIDGLSKEQIAFLTEIRIQIDLLKAKFQDARTLNFNSFKNVDEVVEKLTKQKIDLTFFSHFNSSDTQKHVNIVNKAIDTILETANELQGKIIHQRNMIEKTIEENQDEINWFLRNAGFDYLVNLIPDGNDQYKLKLLHKDIDGEIDNVKTHLSFGERNAFALVLFMYDTLKEGSDLVILDDPISSFDKNKKFAIIEMLFHKQRSFRDRTVIMLTHDFEPIIDMILHHRDSFQIPSAYFLENNNGVLIEKNIDNSDIRTFIDILKKNINDSQSDITKLIYLRRLLEVNNDKGFAFNLISNVLHKRDVPQNLDRSAMSEEEVHEATQEIIKDVPSFVYTDIITTVKDDKKMIEYYKSTSYNYEKLQLYRIILDNKSDDMESRTIRKFINQTLHIENDYIYQLDPCKYQLVPQYVIDQCDVYIDGLLKKIEKSQA